MEGIKAHFRKRAVQYQATDEVTINTMAGLGYRFIFNINAEETIQLINDDIQKNMQKRQALSSYSYSLQGDGLE